MRRFSIGMAATMVMAMCVATIIAAPAKSAPIERFDAADSRVFSDGPFTLIVGEPGTARVKTFSDVKPGDGVMDVEVPQ